MGSIQALRSDALANRSKSDTNLEISTHMGGVNKSLGGQIVKMIDDLQGVIGSRTKAYNALVGQLNQAINGKGGIGDQGVKWSFQVVNALIQAYGLVAAGTSNPSAVSDAITTITDSLTAILQQQSIRKSLISSYYDYEKMVSQLGYSSVDRAANINGDSGYHHAGAVGLLRLRDSMMLRYKPNDPNFPLTNRGYIGTLRRL